MIGQISPINIFDDPPKKETNPSISNEELKNIIAQLENDLADGTWPDKDYSSMDIKVMPSLIIQANNKYPEMNLNFVASPDDLPIEIKRTIEQEVESSRFIINTGKDGVHFGVIDYKHINGKTSLILFEPTNLNNIVPAIMAFKAKAAFESHQLPDCHFSIAEMDIQRSSSECGIFSLALAKKLYIEKDNLLKMHEENIKGTLCDSDMPLPHNKLDQYLPVTFYKHTQGKTRLNEYLNTNPQEIGAIINKKNETILDRFNKNKFVIYNKELSVSAHKKRITEYKTLLKGNPHENPM